MTPQQSLQAAFARQEGSVPDPGDVLEQLLGELARRRRRRLVILSAVTMVALLVVPGVLLAGLERDRQAVGTPTTPSVGSPALRTWTEPELPVFPLVADPPPSETAAEVKWLGGDRLILQYRSLSDPSAPPSYSVELYPDGSPRPISSDLRCGGRPFELPDLAEGPPTYIGARWSLADGTPVAIRPPQSLDSPVRPSAAEFLAFCESLRPQTVAATVAFRLRYVPVGWGVVATDAGSLSLGRPGSSTASWIVVRNEAIPGSDTPGPLESEPDDELIITTGDGGRYFVVPQPGRPHLTVTIPPDAGLTLPTSIEFVNGITVLPSALPWGY